MYLWKDVLHRKSRSTREGAASRSDKTAMRLFFKLLWTVVFIFSGNCHVVLSDWRTLHTLHSGFLGVNFTEVSVILATDQRLCLWSNCMFFIVLNLACNFTSYIIILVLIL